jgi:predicted nucleotidyltransferase component of viral defense system
MAKIYLHEHPEFPELFRIIEEETGILAGLVEKDYWIMHSLYGLKKQGYNFQLKGGTSLSKGYGLINRFSEDIDIHINPPIALGINENPKNNKEKNIQKKKEYYDILKGEIKIDGIIGVERDTAFDDTKKYNSGGIRLHFKRLTEPIEGVKDGILLEAGYDMVAPNTPIRISSWAYEKAKSLLKTEIIDNRAIDIPCYDHRYTFVEKLQTIASKFRKEMTTGEIATNYMRQYYDVYCLLEDRAVLDFIGTKEYLQHKKLRFSREDFELPIQKNEAFLLRDSIIKEKLQKRYELSKGLYYKGQPAFDDILKRIERFVNKL